MKEVKKGELVNSGKAKSLFKTSDPDLYVLHYRDQLPTRGCNYWGKNSFEYICPYH